MLLHALEGGFFIRTLLQRNHQERSVCGCRPRVDRFLFTGQVQGPWAGLTGAPIGALWALLLSRLEPGNELQGTHCSAPGNRRESRHCKPTQHLTVLLLAAKHAPRLPNSLAVGHSHAFGIIGSNGSSSFTASFSAFFFLSPSPPSPRVWSLSHLPSLRVCRETEHSYGSRPSASDESIFRGTRVQGTQLWPNRPPIRERQALLLRPPRHRRRAAIPKSATTYL